MTVEVVRRKLQDVLTSGIRDLDPARPIDHQEDIGCAVEQVLVEPLGIPE